MAGLASWQNGQVQNFSSFLGKPVSRLPIPFNWMEQQVLKHSDFAIMGNRDSAQVFSKKGYAGPQAIIPQFGTDPAVFKPASELKNDNRQA